MGLSDWIKKFNADKKSRNIALKDNTRNLLYNLLPGLKDAKNPLDFIIDDKQKHALGTLLSQNALEKIEKHKMINLKDKKSLKEMFYHFFGMDEHWPIWRNLLGGFMVHSPEYPTYFIPAFTQASATGEAKDLKKGEGFRGILTGALEGIAVGALVSGRRLKFSEMGPYILMGAGLQYFSSKFFPWIGEKMGRQVYNNKKLLNFVSPDEKIAVKLPEDENSSSGQDKPNVSKPEFSGKNLYKNPYKNTYGGNLKI